MRYLSSVGMLEEVAVDAFAATNVTRVLANPGPQAGIRFLLVSPHRIQSFPPGGLFRFLLVSLATLAVEARVPMLRSIFAYHIR